MQAVHIRYKGKSYDTNSEELGLPDDVASEADLKQAVSRHLDVALAEVSELVVERTDEGIVLRPQAPFG